MNGSQQDLVIFLVSPVVFLLLLGFYRRREGISHFFRRYFVALAAYFLVLVYLSKQHTPPLASLVIAVLVGVAVERLVIPKRSRHIPASVRRKVRAKWELETGKKFNSRLYHLDHDVPFAKGGSHTEENLKVMRKKANLRKGKKSPKWDILGK